MITPENIDALFSFLYTGWIGDVTYWLRMIAGVVTAALVSFIVVVSIKLQRVQYGKYGAKKKAAAETPVPDAELVAKPWQEVLAKLESSHPSDWKLAVIQADSIFDAVLKNMGLAGETLGERLRQLDPSKLASLNDVWEAHKARNRIAHEADSALKNHEARRAVELFGQALRELQYFPSDGE